MHRMLIVAIPLALGLAGCDNEDTLDPDEREALEAVGGAQTDPGDGPGVMHGHRHGHRGRHVIAKLDADQDGAISAAEAEGHRLAHKFDEIDADADGKLTAEELGAFKRRHHKGKRGWGHHKSPEQRAQHIMQKLDADGDGVLTEAEVEGHPRFASAFAKVDADNDGKLTHEELSAIKHPRDMSPQERAQHMIGRFDSDGDGVLTEAEVADHPRFASKFSAADGDGDGKVTADELVTFKRERHGHKRHRFDEPKAAAE